MMLAALRSGRPESRLDAVDLGSQRRLKSTKSGLNPKISRYYLLQARGMTRKGPSLYALWLLECKSGERF